MRQKIYESNTYSGRSLAKHRRERKIKKIKSIFFAFGILIFLSINVINGKEILSHWKAIDTKNQNHINHAKTDVLGEMYPQDLLELLEKNEETYDFVTGYPNRLDYIGKEIDIKEECELGKIPLLLQWDMRWGYDNYGNDMIGLAGCGPTCMTMAYLYLKGDIDMNPRKMAEYAYEKGYYTQAGTSWSFFTEGAIELGLLGKELPLSEEKIKDTLDQGGVVICSMRPGDFTTTGHFILLRGYDENGFFVNDPNSRKNSERQWDFDRLSSQIKCLWSEE